MYDRSADCSRSMLMPPGLLLRRRSKYGALGSRNSVAEVRAWSEVALLGTKCKTLIDFSEALRET